MMIRLGNKVFTWIGLRSVIETLGDMSARLDDLTDALAGMAGDVAELSRRLDDLADDVGGVNVAELSGRVYALRDDLDDLDGRLDDVSSVADDAQFMADKAKTFTDNLTDALRVLDL